MLLGGGALRTVLRRCILPTVATTPSRVVLLLLTLLGGSAGCAAPLEVRENVLVAREVSALTMSPAP
jgi:hypothetical protein